MLKTAVLAGNSVVKELATMPASFAVSMAHKCSTEVCSIVYLIFLPSKSILMKLQFYHLILLALVLRCWPDPTSIFPGIVAFHVWHTWRRVRQRPIWGGVRRFVDSFYRGWLGMIGDERPGQGLENHRLQQQRGSWRRRLPWRSS